MRGIVIAAEGAERTAELARQEAELADRMAAAERRRFQLGASDFFLLNLREEGATDARVRLLDAQARATLAAADLAGATADPRPLRARRNQCALTPNRNLNPVGSGPMTEFTSYLGS